MLETGMHPGMDEAGTVRRLDGIRVLVVEDDKDTLELLCHVLAVEGAVFVCVGSGGGGTRGRRAGTARRAAE
jgi:CheY-like chemotaxis protein